MFKSNISKIVLSLVAAVAFWLVLILLHSFFSGLPSVSRVIEALGGTSNGYIQALMYALFFYSIFELSAKKQSIQSEFEGFEQQVLPERDQLVLSPEEVAKIKLDIIQKEKDGQRFLINKFIKKACTQYRNDKSIPDTLQVFNAQVDNSKDEEEGKLEIVRYLLGAIVSLGFIGTLMGLSSSIGMAHLAKTAEGMPTITSQLNVAFDTTLVALVIGLVLNFFYHRYLASIDTFYSRTKSYVIDNLISRIYVPV
ncbi:MAG: MotA/TolQ/ExbB proton channel family protein [Bacteroidota bacterium]